MKKFTRIAIFVFMILSVATMGASAVENNKQYTYEVGDTVYTVEFEDSTLDEEQQKAVAQRLIGNVNGECQTYGLGCILFGHDLKESVVSVITHKVRTYAPRCKREIYDVTICQDCDYQTQTLSTTGYTDCCPEE